MDILMNLEPRSEAKDVYLAYELDEFNEVFFFINGTFQIGFELNRKIKYVARY